MYGSMDSAMAQTDMVVNSVYVLFITGCIYLFVCVPYSIFKYFALKRYRSDSMEYVYQKLQMESSSQGKQVYLSKKRAEKLHQILEEIKELPSYTSGKTVKSLVQKICGYVPDGKLYLYSVLALPVTSSLVVLFCSTFGDSSFLGFFMLLGFLGASPFVYLLFIKLNKEKNRVANEEMQHHTARLLDFIQNK